MAEFVVIRLGRDHDQMVDWIVADDNGTRHSEPFKGSLDDASAQVQGRPVIVLLPATETLTTTVDIPGFIRWKAYSPGGFSPSALWMSPICPARC